MKPVLSYPPLPILVVALVFLCFPFFLFFSAASLFDLHGNYWMVFSKLQTFQILLCFLCFAIAYGLLFRKKFGYYLFLLFSLLLLAYNFWILGSHLLGKKLQVGGIPVQLSQLVWIALLTVSFLGFLFYFLQREIAAPYLSEEERGWRFGFRDTRPIPFSVSHLDGTKLGSGVTVNISDSGALLQLPDRLVLPLGSQNALQFTLESEDRKAITIEIQGEIVRLLQDEFGNPCAGVRFLGLREDSHEKKEFQLFLKRVFAPRYPASNPTKFQFPEGSGQGKLVNVSHEGLYVETSTIPQSGTEVTLTWRSPLLGNLGAVGHVRWANPGGTYGKPPGFGIKITERKTPFRFSVWIFLHRLLIFQGR